MNGPLGEEVIARVPWLLKDHGFRITAQDYDYKSFGNSCVELQSDQIQLRFLRDRGLVYLDVAAPTEPKQWFELGSLWAALTGDRPEPQLEGWACFFRDHAPELAEAVGPRLSDTKAAWDRQVRKSQGAARLQTPRRSLTARLLNLRSKPLVAFALGPLGWMVAAALLFWNSTK